MKGISRSTLYTLDLLKRNLEEGALDLNDPLALAWICKQLSELIYDIHEELLKRGDEVNAIKIFEELFLPFDRMAKFYEKLAGKKVRKAEARG